MTAAEIAKALGGRRAGSCYVARCPAHDDSSPSLAIADGGNGRALVRCHAGCEQAVVINELRARGLWDGAATPRDPVAEAKRRDADLRQERKRTDLALRIWRERRPAEGSPVETYLRIRGLVRPIPQSIGFHPALRHLDTGLDLPAMVAAVQSGDGTVVAVHRTYLRADGSGKANVTNAKMMLGPCAGGAVRFAIAGPRLAIGEGIETCLSVRQECPDMPIWAALSAPGLTKVVIPESVRELTILADRDDTGERAAQDLARRADVATLRVRIARPPNGAKDFNDALLAEQEERARG